MAAIPSRPTATSFTRRISTSPPSCSNVWRRLEYPATCIPAARRNTATPQPARRKTIYRSPTATTLWQKLPAPTSCACTARRSPCPAPTSGCSRSLAHTRTRPDSFQPWSAAAWRGNSRLWSTAPFQGISSTSTTSARPTSTPRSICASPSSATLSTSEAAARPPSPRPRRSSSRFLANPPLGRWSDASGTLSIGFPTRRRPPRSCAGGRAPNSGRVCARPPTGTAAWRTKNGTTDPQSNSLSTRNAAYPRWWPATRTPRPSPSCTSG